MTDQTNKLEPCPFCGGKAYIDQHGTRRQSCVISCHTCGCMLETNEEGANCGDQWNRRASAPAADQEAYEQECLNMTAEGIKYWKDKYEALVAASAPTTAPIEALSSECNECGGTGLRDLGGFYPWGEPTMIECDCISKMPTPNAPTAGSVPSDAEILAVFAETQASGQGEYICRAVRALLAQYGAPRGVPDAVLHAVKRMSQPLDPSRLSGATAQADAEDMKTIADFINALAAPQEGE